ncbi:uncharacterized protein [Amphiura filiformis]|uniref:uncharacterized protein n=1 Tax=Amphiura filiformis TaxID=82378 RepID=UPI003B226C0F
MTVDLKKAKAILQEALIVLTDNLTPTNVLRQMKGKNALTADEVIKINKGDTDTEKVEKLIDTLARKPLTSYQWFLEILKEDRYDLYEEVKKIEAKHTDNTKPPPVPSPPGHGSGMVQVTDKDISTVTGKVGLTRDKFKKDVQRAWFISRCHRECREDRRH